MSLRPRILIFGGEDGPTGDLLARCQGDWDVVRTGSFAEGLVRLRSEHFDAVLLQPADRHIWEKAESLIHADSILQVLEDGVALVDQDLRITWCNQTFQNWCEGPAVGRSFYEALGSPEILGPDYCPFHTALTGRSVVTSLHRRDHRYLELHVTPVPDAAGKIHQLISQVRDVTAAVQKQAKLDALHQAGRELAALPAEQLAEMGVEERVELLKANIRRLTHDLLQYSVVEIRILDRATGRLEPLLEEGMTSSAARRVLYARPEDNGVTGFVAATGKSYLCHDTDNDPLYIEGAEGARSSMTVALTVGDEVIGTFNVESPSANTFAEQDLQFLELFGREVAMALHTLNLLSAEKRGAVSQFVEAIRREVAMPVDGILHAASALLDRWIGHEPEMESRLRQILEEARSVKQVIQKVGEDLTPAHTGPPGEYTNHPRLRGMKVLVTDNDERVRRSAHAILGRYGCVVETARDGKEALTMARLTGYDSILTDIRLPDMGGYEIYQKLRQAQPAAQVILMTAFGYDPSHAIVKARQDGLQFVLYKPFRVDQLLAALENEGGSGNGQGPAATRQQATGS